VRPVSPDQISPVGNSVSADLNQHSKRAPARQHDRIVREAERRVITGVPTSGWYAMQAKGTAPKPVRLGPRAVGWLLSELQGWIAAQRAKRDDAAADYGGGIISSQRTR
jgi:prophage regulatory protein